jgi:hypothetical protein
MKLYFIHVANQFVGTQAEAKALSKEHGLKFVPEQDEVEVPTDKAGLIDYLNRLIANAPRAEDPDRVVKDVNEDIEPTLAPKARPYAELSTNLDELFAGAPLAHRLTLASLALEDARVAIPVLERIEAQVADDEVDPFA